ncbi:hypothetical protein DV704_08205 [Meiothermus sp. QL-1]|uniref:zinc ribbon domain-containing protein n=1 Tax=Meiothermus sp. QL-1 TaxID=2058095 RepID=UPI000E0ABC28|nr:C4-type zinc ribbon domain-containing protein [Meiothermus sp. QL-1]RDI95277.1 hypothetical protein DV704_08205 [Meiothermus sp. QL-1]
MSDPLAELNRLQERDLELDRIREDQAQVPEELRQARSHRKALEERILLVQEELNEARLAYQRLELELQSLKEKHARAKQFSQNATTAKEQMQYNEQMRQLEDRIEEIEGNDKKNIPGEILPLLERKEALEEELEKLRAELAQAEARLEELEAANQKRVDTLEATYQAKKADRDQLAATIPPAIVKEYESIRRARRGTGLARMVKAGSGYRCTACNVQLPMHVAQQIHLGQKIVRCPSCGRILWKGE